jgi:ribulose-5-phosphate 4-epimerase/fuculose-1-phosphate aldolase
MKDRRTTGLGVFIALALVAAPVAAQEGTPIAPQALIDDLVAANHVLYNEGVLDGYGHVSVRSPTNPQHFLMSRSLAPALVTAADIMEFDLDGKPIDPRGRLAYQERFIHSEIYKARPDVKAIVHSHAPAVIPFGITAEKLRPVYHMGSFLGDCAPVFEIRDGAGTATDLLIRTPAIGAALAKTLGNASVVLLRGHGDAVVGTSLPEAVFRAI